MPEPPDDGDDNEQKNSARREQQRPRHGGTSVWNSESADFNAVLRADRAQLHVCVCMFMDCVETTGVRRRSYACSLSTKLSLRYFPERKLSADCRNAGPSFAERRGHRLNPPSGQSMVD